MARYTYTDIAIRGRTYANADEAAADLGVHPATVRNHIRAGTLHRLARGLSGPEPTPVCVRGVNYQSPKEAAEALGVGINLVYCRLAAGRPDSIGLPNNRGQHRAKPFELGPLAFRSQSEASRALGYHDDYVGRALRSGSRRQKERLIALVMAHAERLNRERGAHFTDTSEEIEHD